MAQENQALRGETGTVTSQPAGSGDGRRGGAAAAPASVREEGGGALFLEDGRDFENYIRRLAGIKVRPAPGRPPL